MFRTREFSRNNKYSVLELLGRNEAYLAGAGPYCNYSCNPYSKAKNNKEKTMPRIRKLEQVEKSTKSRKMQKNKTKHNMYQLVEVAYHVST